MVIVLEKPDHDEIWHNLSIGQNWGSLDRTTACDEDDVILLSSISIACQALRDVPLPSGLLTGMAMESREMV